MLATDRTPNDAQEHLCLVRHLAALQARVSRQMVALAEAEARARARAEAAERACRALERALIVERGRAVLACTRWSWGWGGPPPAPLASVASHGRSPVTTAVDVLCQTGCQGHAHPWLGPEGGCRLTGADCTRVAEASVADGVPRAR